MHARGLSRCDHRLTGRNDREGAGEEVEFLIQQSTWLANLFFAKRHAEPTQAPSLQAQFRIYFSMNGQMVAGDGEVRDQATWDCRVTISPAVPLESSWNSVSFLEMKATHPVLPHLIS